MGDEAKIEKSKFESMISDLQQQVQNGLNKEIEVREENEKKFGEKTSQFLKSVENMQSKYQEDKDELTSGYEKKIQNLNTKCGNVEEQLNELNSNLRETMKNFE